MPSRTNLGASESPTKTGATVSCSSSTMSSVRNCVWTVPAALDHQPVDASRRQVGAERAHLHVVAGVDDGRDRPETLARVRHPRARAVDDLLGVPDA